MSVWQIKPLCSLTPSVSSTVIQGHEGPSQESQKVKGTWLSNKASNGSLGTEPVAGSNLCFIWGLLARQVGFFGVCSQERMGGLSHPGSSWQHLNLTGGQVPCCLDAGHVSHCSALPGGGREGPPGLRANAGLRAGPGRKGKRVTWEWGPLGQPFPYFLSGLMYF